MKSLFNTFTGLVLKNICEIMSLIFQLYFYIFVSIINRRPLEKKYFWPFCEACSILVPRPGTEPWPLVVRA